MGGKRQVCAASEGRLRRGGGEMGRGLGRARGKGTAGLVREEEGEDGGEKGIGLVSPGWSLRLVPGTAPGDGDTRMKKTCFLSLWRRV